MSYIYNIHYTLYKYYFETVLARRITLLTICKVTKYYVQQCVCALYNAPVDLSVKCSACIVYTV